MINLKKVTIIIDGVETSYNVRCHDGPDFVLNMLASSTRLMNDAFVNYTMKIYGRGSEEYKAALSKID